MLLGREARADLVRNGGRFGLTLILASVGGAAFAWLRMPLAWMIGAMLVTTVAALAGAALHVPNRFRSFMIAILGVLLGSAFSPDLLGRLGHWAVGGVVQVGFVAALTAVGYTYFRRAAGLDQVTAFFSSTPGGLTTMALLGESMGADIRVISLIHATRVLFVVTVIPFYFRIAHGIAGRALPAVSSSLLTIAPRDATILAAAGMIGVPLGRILRAPAPSLIGPILVSAALHIGGIARTAPPAELIAAAQVAIGASIGARFSDMPIGVVMRTMRMAAGSSALMLLAAALAGTGLAPLVGESAAALVLALAPGGLAEMALTALSLGTDTAFVSTMHILRIGAILVLAPIAFRWIGRARRKSALTGN